MTNPLASRSVSRASGSSQDQCPAGYESAQAWCDWRNGTMQNGGRKDIEWIVGPHGTPILIDDQNWSWRHAEQTKEREKVERQRHNHRIMNPVA